MKKTFATLGALLIALIINAQSRLDTVYWRNSQLKMEELWWGIKGINSDNLDSVQSKQYNKLTRAMKDGNLSSAQLFTYDSLPGVFAMIFFLDYWRNPEARENMGTGLDAKPRTYPPLLPYIQVADSLRLVKFNNRKTSGKNKTN